MNYKQKGQSFALNFLQNIRILMKTIIKIKSNRLKIDKIV